MFLSYRERGTKKKFWAPMNIIYKHDAIDIVDPSSMQRFIWTS